MKTVRIIQSPRVVGAGVILALLIAWSICSGCGIIFAPIMVPAAIAANHDESARGVVVDESGQAIQQIKLHIEGDHTWWDAGAGTITKYEESDKIANGTFGFYRRTSNVITLTFEKEGFYKRVMALSEGKVFTDSPAAISKGYDSISVRSENEDVTLVNDPTIKPNQIRVVMHSTGPTVALDYFTGTLSDEPSRRAILLKNTGAPEGIVQPPNAPAQVPQNSMYIVAKRDDHGNIMITNPEDPCGCHTIAELRIRVSSAGAGLLRFEPHTTHPFREMNQAPETGYQPEIVLTAADIDAFPQGKIYFYVMANNRYGRLSMEIKPLELTDGHAKQVDATVELQMAKDPGRNLNNGK